MYSVLGIKESTVDYINKREEQLDKEYKKVDEIAFLIV